MTLENRSKELMMKGRRHTPEQVVRNLTEADKLLGEGFELAGRAHGVGNLGGAVSPLDGAVGAR
jgi:hypothetical protein